MRILILDKDTDYSGRLKYCLSQKYSQLFITVCDNLDSAKNIKLEDAFDIILFDVSFDEVDIEKLSNFIGKAAFAYISETNEVAKNTETIMKYIRVSEMFRKLCELYEKKRDRVIKQVTDQGTVKNETEIILLHQLNLAVNICQKSNFSASSSSPYGSMLSSSSLINLFFDYIFWQCLIGGAIA